MELNNVANTAAILEVYFKKIINEDELFMRSQFEVLDVFTYKRGEEETYPSRKYPKAITVRDKEGNIYVHFNGTGDGNWGY